MMAEDVAHDIRERMLLLSGDRRASIEIFESCRASNICLIRSLRDASREFRTKLASFPRTSHLPCGVDLDLKKLRKHVDVLREQSIYKSKVFQQLNDAVRDLELQSRTPNQQVSSYARDVRLLENRLDKALIKYNEAQSIKKTYEQIVKRLRDERIGFDHQLATLERALCAKHRDHDELQLLSGDAQHARNVAKAELDNVRAAYEDERRRRESDLKERHHVVQARRHIYNRLQVNEHNRADVRGGHIDRDFTITTPLSEPNYKERTEHRTRINIFETAFRKIKESTGVSDVNEVIQKITTQGCTSDNLMSLSSENVAKIELLNDVKLQLKQHIEEIKYAGPCGGHSRKLVDLRESTLSGSTAKVDRVRAKYERLAKIVMTSRAGVKHLQGKLGGLREQPGDGPLELADEMLGEVMRDNEKVAIELQGHVHHTSANCAAEERLNSRQFDEDHLTVLRIPRPFNQRVELPMLSGWENDAALGESHDLFGSDIEGELTRDKVKRASSQVLMAQDKLAKKTNKVRT
mmetsp:Transcript_10748/g.34389  ORF Transcript_10748/g.34389 Transcript_10748/m.34389 type:complete len:522 (+) Transcript_10748:245-1810(+)